MQRNKSKVDVFWDLNITFKYFVCLKKKSVNSKCTFFQFEIIQTKVDIKSVTKDYSLRNYVVNV